MCMKSSKKIISISISLSAVVLTFVNCWDVGWATKVQDTFTYAKLLALFIIIITGAYQLFTGHTEHFTFKDSKHEVTNIALSFYSGLFAYNGWNYLNFIIEELKDPVKNLPRAIGISCLLVTIVYVFANAAFYTTLSPADVLKSEAVAVTFANRLYGSMAWIIPVFVAMSTFGAMPEILTMIQIQRLTPTPAVLTIALLSLLYLTVSDIFALINYVGFATWLSIGVAVLCLPWLRWKQPDLARPIKVNLFFPIIYIIASVFVTVVPMFASPYETLYGTLMILSSVPVYFVFVSWKNKPKSFQRGVVGATRCLQKLMMVVGKQNPSTV
ncbi:hypothetical protein FOCC_FOCC001666 [Frankliniella occidentalis]|nr:hypothetical protein FOCC_FOCC001666 [Frankliniella occidentalis]